MLLPGDLRPRHSWQLWAWCGWLQVSGGIYELCALLELETIVFVGVARQQTIEIAMQRYKVELFLRIGQSCCEHGLHTWLCTIFLAKICKYPLTLVVKQHASRPYDRILSDDRKVCFIITNHVHWPYHTSCDHQGFPPNMHRKYCIIKGHALRSVVCICDMSYCENAKLMTTTHVL